MKKQRMAKFIVLLFSIILMMNILSIFTRVNANTYTQTTKTGIENFPTDYQDKLNELKKMYPNWNFTAYYTGITWEEFINAETSVHFRNSVIKTATSLWKDSCGIEKSGYVCASKEIIEYYADPRNFLNESGIFQFLEMTYNEKAQTEEDKAKMEAAVKKLIANSFMDKEITVTINNIEKTMHYSTIIMEAAKESKMSPYSIAIKIIQEVGRKGSSSVSGYYVGASGTEYKGYYNFFNYGSYDSGDAIENGLKFAKENGWTNSYIAIVEGAKLMANSYTNAGQNTAYFYKWDVVGNDTSNLFWHQYMTNVQDPASQAKNLYNTYAQNNLLSEPLNFIIPVYGDVSTVNNLPTTIDTTSASSYYLTGSDVRLRATPSTSSSILASLDKNVVVTLLEWNVGSANGYEWAKIRLANGIEGYIANKYLKACNESNNTDVNDNSNENNSQTNTKSFAKIDGEYILTIPDVKNIELAEELKLEKYTILDSEGKDITSNGYAGTGNKLIIGEKEYTIIIYGDINGDVSINSGDLLLLKKHLLGNSGITDSNKIKAMDINHDNSVNSGDLLFLKKHLLGTSKISL